MQASATYSSCPAWRSAVAALLLAAPASTLAGAAAAPERIYQNHCAVCHGDRGDGNSRARASLVPPPLDLTSTVLPRATMIASITHGKPGTAMVGWSSRLSAQEIEEVTDFIRDRFMRVALDPQLVLGRRLYDTRCVACHGATGRGTGGNGRRRDLTARRAWDEPTAERMLAAVRDGHTALAMPAFGARLTAEESAAVVAFIQATLLPPAPAHQTTDGARYPNGLTGDVAAGRTLYLKSCVNCHGARGDGQGRRARGSEPPPRVFTDIAFRHDFDRAKVYYAVVHGRRDREMPAWGVLSEQQRSDIAEYVYQTFIAAPGLR